MHSKSSSIPCDLSNCVFSVLQCNHLHLVLTSDARWLSGVLAYRPSCHWKVDMILLSMTNIWVIVVMGPMCSHSISLFCVNVIDTNSASNSLQTLKVVHCTTP